MGEQRATLCTGVGVKIAVMVRMRDWGGNRPVANQVSYLHRHAQDLRLDKRSGVEAVCTIATDLCACFNLFCTLRALLQRGQ